MTAPTIHPAHGHGTRRTAAARDIANRLLIEATAARYAELVEAAIARACELSPVELAEVGRRDGHYTRPGALPADGTISELLEILEAMRPAPGLVFEGIAS